MTAELRLGAISAVLFAAFAALGIALAKRPLTRLDAQAIYFRSQWTPLARLFTRSGRSPALTTACVISILVYALLRLPIWIPLTMSLSQLLSQMIVEYCKMLFKRVRPHYWLIGLEAGHSYPSGHATTGIVFFTGWSVVVALSALSGSWKTGIIAAFTVWALGILWSRLALGAHYFSDLAGGILFGAAWLCGVLAISSHFYGILR